VVFGQRLEKAALAGIEGTQCIWE